MTKPKFLTKKFIESALRFVLYFLAVALTPLLGKATAPMWDWIGYGSVRGLFTEINTAFFWAVETVAFFFLFKLFKEKEEDKPQEAEPKQKEKKAPIPRKNLYILSGICLGSVLLLSVVIGFQVKPFFDLGEKVTGYDILCTVGALGRNIVKMLWTVALFLNGLRMADEIIAAYGLTKKPWLRLLLSGSFLMLFGIFDIFTWVLTYPVGGREILIAVVYFLFYAVFPIVYYYTEESRGKTYLIMTFIYLF